MFTTSMDGSSKIIHACNNAEHHGVLAWQTQQLNLLGLVIADPSVAAKATAKP